MTVNGEHRLGVWKLDRIMLQTTGSFLQRLRRRLLIIILIAVVPILGFIFYQAKVARDLQIAEAQETAWEIVENVAVRESPFLDSAQQLLALLAELPELESDDAVACGDFLTGFSERNPVYVDLGVADSRGDVRCRAQGVEESGNNMAGTSHFRLALKTKSFAIGDFEHKIMSQRKGVNFAYPVTDDQGRVRLVIFAALDVNWINQLAVANHLPAGIALSIVDSKGTLLARFPDADKWVGKHIPDASLFEMLQLRSQLTRELVGLDGVDRLYALKPLSLHDAAGQIYVMVGIPKELAYGPVNRALARNLAWVVAVSVAATSLAWLIGSTFVVGYVKIRAEAEEARVQLAAIVESSEDAIIGMTLDGRVTSWNEGAESMYGYDRYEIIGQSIYRLIPETHHNEVTELLDIVKRDLGINRYESRRMRKDGQLFDVSASLSPIRDLQGNVIGAATITRDITLLRKGEEQLLAYTDQLEALNLASQEIAGTLSVEEVIERGLSRLVSAGGFEVALARAKQDGAESKFYGASSELRSAEELKKFWHQLGREFEQCFWECRNAWFVEDVAAAPEIAFADDHSPFKALAVLPLSSGGSLQAAIALLSARIHPFGTDEKQFLQAMSRQIALAVENARLYGATLEVNQELRREIEERLRAERALADFTAMVAHDLRSPLSNVVSIIDSVRDGLFGAITELQQKWLWKVQVNCTSLIHHVSDFLDISKIDAGKLELVKAPVDVASMLHDSLQEHSIEADKRKITLKTDISDCLPHLYVDCPRMNQVLDNLLSNALKFTDIGGEIEIAARVMSSSGMILSVRDSGVGIPQDELELIFDKYRQVNGGQNSTCRGTGLGLAICKKIIEAHGGRIWAESELGRGSTFYVSLPLPPEETVCAIPA
ncbi:MAG TPA: ATP-binding protein [Candidatus Binatia bacterium]